ncbi:MAG: imidazoleglycerol-phosphate dehydratase HisB [Desulfonauticus sp.]|nr:imidazoleglycerol-phosphate dehydratase HisB [Desulfonauticus sp.]
MRKATIQRETKETQITLDLNLDGKGKTKIDTELAYFNHMLELMAFWGRFDLTLKAKGDIQIDAHHLIEDVGICLGKAFAQAWGNRQGIQRIAAVKVPMDEALVEAVIDLSGRPYFVAKGYDIVPDIVFGEEKDVFREFFKSVSFSARFNLHLNWCYGQNGHHLLEASFKALGLVLKQAIAKNWEGISSTKGVLD